MNRSYYGYKISSLTNRSTNQIIRDGFKQTKKLMEFSIKLAGWVLDALVFH